MDEGVGGKIDFSTLFIGSIRELKCLIRKLIDSFQSNHKAPIQPFMDAFSNSRSIEMKSSILSVNVLFALLIFKCCAFDEIDQAKKDFVKLLIMKYYQTKSFAEQKEFVLTQIDYNKLIGMWSEAAVKHTIMVYIKGEQKELNNKIRNLFLEPKGAADSIIEYLNTASYEDIYEVVMFFRDSFFEALVQARVMKV